MRLTWILPTCTSRLVCSSCRMAKLLLAPPTRATRQCLRMFILKPTSLRQYMVLLLLSGVHLNLSNLPKAQPHRHWQELAGIGHSLRFAILAFLLNNSTLTSRERASAPQLSTLPSGPSALGRKPPGRTQNRLVLLQMVRVLRGLSAHHHQVDLYVAACHPRPRLIMSLLALTILLHLSSPLRLRRPNLRHRCISLNSSHSQIVSQILTMVLMLVMCLLHRHHHLLA